MKKTLGNLFPYLISGITVHSYIQQQRSLQSSMAQSDKIDSLLKRNEELTNFVDKIQEYDISAAAQAEIGRFKSINADAMYHKNMMLEKINKIKESVNPQDVETLKRDLDYHSEMFQGKIENHEHSIQNLSETIKTILIDKNSGNNNNLIVLDQFKEFLSTLTLEQLGALSHILLCIAMLFSVSTIVFVIFGDFLIIKFKLEEKYPKLARFIELRRKVQYFSLISNIILIVLSLFVIIYLNVLVFMK
jgi:hypothetical protein